MSSKAGLRLRQGTGEGEVLGVQHPLREACVHPVYGGNQGRFWEQETDMAGISLKKVKSPTPSVLTMMARKYTNSKPFFDCY